VKLRSVVDASDPDLAALSQLMDATFADPNVVLGLDRMQEFLLATRPDGPRRFCVLVAKEAGRVMGGCVFSHVARSNCGFSEYIVTDRAVRSQGVGRLLFDARKAILDAEAARLGQGTCHGVFIEVGNPQRTPPDLAAAERETALDAWERLRIFDHLGFRRVDVPYVQPPLAENKIPIDYLDLLFACWNPRGTDHIPAAWVFDTVDAIWTAWTPRTAAAHLETLKRRVPSAGVALRPALESPVPKGA
jgi:GNAT superfamily N-acetyltransferase